MTWWTIESGHQTLLRLGWQLGYKGSRFDAESPRFCNIASDVWRLAIDATQRICALSDFIYLASLSPRRRQLLAQIGVRYQLLAPDDDEDAEELELVLPGERPAAYVSRVTGLKLDAAVARLKRSGLLPAPILCADTTVALGRAILGKPQDDSDARRMLSTLAGRTHRVVTAVAVQAGQRRLLASCDSRVSVGALTEDAIRDYVRSGESVGKAGAYGIQGRFAAHIAKISGSYSGIMGLPLFETSQLLRAAAMVF